MLFTGYLGREEQMADKMIKCRFGEVFVELDGNLINIKDLPQYEYEWFLENMRATRIAYKVLKESRLHKNINIERIR